MTDERLDEIRRMLDLTEPNTQRYKVVAELVAEVERLREQLRIHQVALQNCANDVERLACREPGCANAAMAGQDYCVRHLMTY